MPQYVRALKHLVRVAAVLALPLLASTHVQSQRVSTPLSLRTRTAASKLSAENVPFKLGAMLREYADERDCAGEHAHCTSHKMRTCASIQVRTPDALLSAS
eukprot:6198670-Pleurochrysis_carterae.AAC.2